ncbi:PadR family transcriptional regulator [Kitasatospora gansuensis]
MLTALADAPRHGYAILQEVLTITEGRTRMLTGTLYTALDRLLQQGLIRIDHEEVVAGRLRRSFALTEQGRAHADRGDGTAARRRDRGRAPLALGAPQPKLRTNWGTA